MESLELTLSGCKLYLRQGDDLSSCMTFPIEKEEHPPGRILRTFANVRVRGQGSFVELHLRRKLEERGSRVFHLL